MLSWVGAELGVEPDSPRSPGGSPPVAGGVRAPVPLRQHPHCLVRRRQCPVLVHYLRQSLGGAAGAGSGHPETGLGDRRRRAADDGQIGLDGTLISTTRAQVEEPTRGIDLFWSAKHHRHGVNLQVHSVPDGSPLWIVEVRPGCEHDANAVTLFGVEVEIALLNMV